MIDWNSIGLPAPSLSSRVVVAMSGGVDSSVVAALCHEAGYDVVGITMQLYDQGESTGKTCCAGKDIRDAQEVAQMRGFPHYVLNYQSRFQSRVIDHFADSYIRGETPIPCITCNQTVKFEDLLQAAKNLNASALVTGHYVQRIQKGTNIEMHTAVDSTKDQSYFLFATTAEQLEFLRFPLGGITKEQTRLQAERLGLQVAHKKDSQDICFVPNGDYRRVVQNLRPDSLIPGNIRHEDGSILGKHEGIINFTIGQRKGIQVGGRSQNDTPLYVLSIDPDTHTVIVGPKESLRRQYLYLKNVNCFNSSIPIGECHVKIRSSGPSLPAYVSPDNKSVTLHTPEYGVSRGQACVFYKGTHVLGGGFIQGSCLESA